MFGIFVVISVGFKQLPNKLVLGFTYKRFKWHVQSIIIFFHKLCLKNKSQGIIAISLAAPMIKGKLTKNKASFKNQEEFSCYFKLFNCIHKVMKQTEKDITGIMKQIIILTPFFRHYISEISIECFNVFVWWLIIKTYNHPDSIWGLQLQTFHILTWIILLPEEMEKYDTWLLA